MFVCFLFIRSQENYKTFNDKRLSNEKVLDKHSHTHTHTHTEPRNVSILSKIIFYAFQKNKAKQFLLEKFFKKSFWKMFFFELNVYLNRSSIITSLSQRITNVTESLYPINVSLNRIIIAWKKCISLIPLTLWRWIFGFSVVFLSKIKIFFKQIIGENCLSRIFMCVFPNEKIIISIK